VTGNPVRDRYDRFASSELHADGVYEVVTPGKAYFRARKLETAVRMGRFPPGARLLEVGCSVGQFTFPLAERGYAMHGVDLSGNSIEVARKRAAGRPGRGLTFSVADAERLDFPDGSFDGALSFSTLRYVPDLPRALSQIRRVIKPDGRVVLDFPNRFCPWFYLKPWLGSERHPNDRWFTAEELRRLFREAGFEQVRVETILFTPTVAPARLLPAFRLLDRLGERVPGLRRLAGILMVAAVRR
jgi:SAM-dependent methyltransferase